MNTIEERAKLGLDVLLPKRHEATPIPWDVWERTQVLAHLACRSFNALTAGKTIVPDAQINIDVVLGLIKTMGCTKKTCGVDTKGKPWCENPKHIYMHLVSPCINTECESECEWCTGGVMTQFQRTAFFRGEQETVSASNERDLIKKK